MHKIILSTVKKMEEYESEQEAIDDFLDNNLKALKEYNSRFVKCVHHDCELSIASNAQKSIRTLYIKRLDEWYNSLPFLKKNERTNHVLSRVKELGSCDPISFREKVKGLITEIGNSPATVNRATSSNNK